MNLTSFSSTEQLFDKIQTLLSTGVARNTKIAGDLFEKYTQQHHLEFEGYFAVYDSNDKLSIPDEVIDRLDAWEFFDKSETNSFGIDKISVTKDPKKYKDFEIDVHQDKSTLHMDKNLSTEKAAKMMSCVNNPLKNVRKWILNTTAQDISHYASVWKDHPCICYGYDYFVGDDAESKKRDLEFWKNIKLRTKNKPTTNIYDFAPRNSGQTDWIIAGKIFAEESFKQTQSAKWHQLGVGALGKSVVDPVMLAELEYLFDPNLTNTPKPISVSFYHSSKTLPKNGLEEVRRRRAKGIYDEVFVVSGTQVIDGENDSNLRTIFPKENSPAGAVTRIINALDAGKSVLILALYHNSKHIADIKTLLNDIYPGFRFWYRKRDECDWPAGSPESSFAYALDNRTDSVITYGSSGTERESKDPTGYGTNNVAIHGPCIHKFTWGEAEDQDLVKPLIMITPHIKESEFAVWYPEFVNQKTGRVEWDLKVNGNPVNEEFPTVGLIADLTAIVLTMYKYPALTNGLAFSHRVKNNKLAEVNWLDICDRVLPKDASGKRVRKVFWQVLNDDRYDSSSLKDDKWRIKQALKHKNNIVAACRLIGRGYDQPKHNWATHLDAKGIVDTCQEIWRATRKDPDNTDPFAYYVLPLRFNDLDDEPSFSEDRLQQLQAILEQHTPIRDQFELITQNTGGGGKKRARLPGVQRIILPENFDPTQLGSLYNWYQYSRKLEIVENLYAEAHSWLLSKYMSCPDLNLNNNKLMGAILNEFLSQDRFKPLFSLWKLAENDKHSFKANFWTGAYVRDRKYSDTIRLQVYRNVIEFDNFKKQSIAKRKHIDAQIKKEAPLLFSRVPFTGRRFANVSEILSKKYNLSTAIVNRIMGNLYATLQTNKTHWKKIHSKIVDILINEADKSSGYKEWASNAISQFEDNGISTYNVTPIIVQKAFLRGQFSQLSKLAEVVKDRGYRKTAAVRESKVTTSERQQRTINIKKALATKKTLYVKTKTPLA